MSGTFVLILLIVILGLVAVILIRDKPLRDKVLAFFHGIGKKVTRLRLQQKIKSGQRAKDGALQRLGQAAWKGGHKPETAAEAVRELGLLDDAIKAKNGEIEKNEAEAARIKQAQAEFVESQKAKIKEQEDKARPHREELTRVQANLREVESRISEVEKILRDAETELRRADGDLAKTDADASLTPDQKQVRNAESRARAQAAVQQKTAAEPKLAPLRGEQAALKKTCAEIQATIDGYTQAIRRLADEQKEKTRVADAQTADLAKKDHALRSEIKDLEKKEEPHWTALGRDIHGRRIDDSALTVLYAEIDNLDRNMRDIEERLKSLEK